MECPHTSDNKTRHNFTAFKDLLKSCLTYSNEKCLLIVQCSKCGATKVVMPLYLIGAKGVGSVKRENVLVLLENKNLIQKNIAKEAGVSASTVTRIKQAFSLINSDEIISDIKKININYPESELARYNKEGAVSITDDRIKAHCNLQLIKIFKTEAMKHYSVEDKYLEQISSIYYYKIYKSGIKIIQINNTS